MKRKPLVWPPKVGDRVHFDTGYDHNSWSAEVRAIVDDDFAVLKRWRKYKGRHVYELLERLSVELSNKNKPMYFAGALPRRKARSEGEKP